MDATYKGQSAHKQGPPLREQRRPQQTHLHFTHEIARDYINAGLSVFPLRLDGSKAPALASWNPYRERFASMDEIGAWFRRPAGIGMVCGLQSGGLEVLDFDDRADETFHAWFDSLPVDVRCRLTVCETGGLGYHVLYRCDEVCGNTKIAMTDTGSVLIESRGEGGYIVATGSPSEVHASGSPYVQVRGIPLPYVPKVSIDERRTMWTLAAALGERPDPLAEYVRGRVKELRPMIDASVVDIDTPWDDYDHRATWDDVLSPAGWTTINGKAWRRPGKLFGTSAVVSNVSDGSKTVLVVFSGNAGPLAPAGVAHRTWTRFGAFAALYHGGDRKAAARAVRALGYGMVTS